MSVKDITQFKNIGMVSERGIGAIGGLAKSIGDTFTATLTFQYQGPGGNFDVGIGFAPAALVGFQNVTNFYPTTVSLPLVSTWTSRTVTVGGQIPTGMAPGLKDILKWIQIAGGSRDPGGNGYQLADWDQDVYEITSVQQFQNLTAVYA